jgi:hypothetical protein
LNPHFFLSDHRLMNVIKNKAFKPGDVTYYFIKKQNINYLFTIQSAYYSSLEKGFLIIKNYLRMTNRNYAIQSGPIKPTANFSTFQESCYCYVQLFMDLNCSYVLIVVKPMKKKCMSIILKKFLRKLDFQKSRKIEIIFR